MTRLVLKMSISLDGYVAPADGNSNWVAAGSSDDAAAWIVETLSGAGAHLMGAESYAAMAEYWPNASGPLADPMNEIPKVAFSKLAHVFVLGEDDHRPRRPTALSMSGALFVPRTQRRNLM